MWLEACAVDDVAPGGVLFVHSGEREILVCNVGGDFYAVGRRCGHAHAPLERGSLDGPYLTCPVHYVQFDVRTGEALNGPVPRRSPGPAALGAQQRSGVQSPRTGHEEATHDLPTYPVRVRDGMVEVEADRAGAAPAG
jgi:nitrite reductase/ring-hydroxylating ferredoxin subunit